MKKLTFVFLLALFAAPFFFNACEKEKLVEVEKLVRDTVYIPQLETDTIFITINDTTIIVDTVTVGNTGKPLPAEFTTWHSNNKAFYDELVQTMLNEYYQYEWNRTEYVTQCYAFYGTASFAGTFLPSGARLTLLGATNKNRLLCVAECTLGSNEQDWVFSDPNAGDLDFGPFNRNFITESLLVGYYKK